MTKLLPILLLLVGGCKPAVRENVHAFCGKVVYTNYNNLEFIKGEQWYWVCVIGEESGICGYEKVNPKIGENFCLRK